MAAVNISPLNINGISPQNLLTDLFSPLQGQDKNYIYPLDLAANPTFSHAVQFTIFDYTTNLAESVGTAGSTAQTLLQQGAAAIQKLATPGGASAAVDNVFSAAKNITPSQLAGLTGKVIQDVAQLDTASNYQIQKGASQATVSLYMPDSLQTSFDSNYTAVSMTETFGLAGYLSSAYADKNFMNKLASGDIANLFNTPEARFAAAKALGIASGKVGGNADAAQAIAQQALKVVPNPQMQLIYQGIGLREFQLDFIFTPISTQEAQAVQNIIDTFSYYSLPDYDPNTKQYLVPPQIFNIKFAFTGNPGILSSISNVFTNTLSTYLGSTAASALVNGSGTNAINDAVGANGNAKIYKVGDCVLKNVAIDYAPNGWATYNDGFPIQTRMTLQFQEMDIVTKSRYSEWTGFKS